LARSKTAATEPKTKILSLEELQTLAKTDLQAFTKLNFSNFDDDTLAGLAKEYYFAMKCDNPPRWQHPPPDFRQSYASLTKRGTHVEAREAM